MRQQHLGGWGAKLHKHNFGTDTAKDMMPHEEEEKK
jgi:hypothetical protein